MENTNENINKDENSINILTQKEKNEVGRGVVVYNAEAEILKNQIEFERICVSVGTDVKNAKDSLRKYHLFLEEKEQYPKGKKAVFAGFEKWLLNEKKFNNGNSGNSEKLGTSAARIKAAEKW